MAAHDHYDSPCADLGTSPISSSFGKAVGDTPAKSLTCFKRDLTKSSAWKLEDAENIGIFYNGPMDRQEWQALLKRKIELTGFWSEFYDEIWQPMVKTYCDLMDDVRYYHDSSSVNQILSVLKNTPSYLIPPAEEHLACPLSDDDDDDSGDYGTKKKKMKKEVKVMDVKNSPRYMLIKAQWEKLTKAEEHLMDKKKYTKENKNVAIISRMVEFLKNFEAILAFWLQQGVLPPEAAFQHLFQTFAAIFRIPFRPGRALGKRSIQIFGTPVSCVPDLLYTESAFEDTSNFVVTVAEVACKEEECKPRSIDLRDGRASQPPPTSTSSVYIPLPDGVKVQHAVQLLMEAPLALPESDDTKKCMLGLIVQATKVRLTYFEIDKDHLDLLQQPKPQPLGGRSALVRFSNAYDMFVKEDRKDLVHMMMGLAAIGNQYRKTPFYQHLM